MQRLVVAAAMATAVSGAAAQVPPLPNAVRPFVKIDAPVVALTHVRVIDGTGGAPKPISP